LNIDDKFNKSMAFLFFGKWFHSEQLFLLPNCLVIGKSNKKKTFFMKVENALDEFSLL